MCIAKAAPFYCLPPSFGVVFCIFCFAYLIAILGVNDFACFSFKCHAQFIDGRSTTFTVYTLSSVRCSSFLVFLYPVMAFACPFKVPLGSVSSASTSSTSLPALQCPLGLAALCGQERGGQRLDGTLMGAEAEQRAGCGPAALWGGLVSRPSKMSSQFCVDQNTPSIALGAHATSVGLQTPGEMLL